MKHLKKYNENSMVDLYGTPLDRAKEMISDVIYYNQVDIESARHSVLSNISEIIRDCKDHNQTEKLEYYQQVEKEVMNVEINESIMKHLNKFNEGWFSKDKENSPVEAVNSKIQDAAYSLKTFGTMTKQGAFINGAKWAIHNLTDDEIKLLRENSDPGEHSFFGL